MSWGVSPWVILFGTLWVFWAWVAISFLILGKFSTIISSSIFSWPLFLSFLGLLWFKCWGVLTLSQRSLRLSSFNSFFLSASFISTILSSTSFILYSASVIVLLVPSRVLFDLSYCVIHYWLFLISSRSLLNISWIFSILVSNLFIKIWIIFTITILNSSSGGFPISSSFIWFGGHLSCSFKC